MRVKLKSTYASPSGIVQIGGTVDIETDLATQLVKGGFAEWVDHPIETAAEAAEKPTPIKRGRKKAE